MGSTESLLPVPEPTSSMTGYVTSTFNRFDKNGNGRLGDFELRGLLSELYGKIVSPWVVKQVREKIDADSDGKVQPQELVNVWPQLEQLIREAEDRGELEGVMTPGPFFAVAESDEPSEKRPRTHAAAGGSSLDQEVLTELNLARTQPSTYLRFIQEELELVSESGLLERPGCTPLRLNEGKRAYEDAIRYLQSQAPVGPVAMAEGLCLAATDHCTDQGRTGETGHDGSDGSNISERMSRFGAWLGKCGENISYGPNTGRDIMLGLIVDDGVPNRGHRHNIYTPDWKVVGIASGSHSGGFSNRVMCVQDFAEGYISKPASGAARKSVGKVVVYGGDDGPSKNWSAALESQGVEFQVMGSDAIPSDLLFQSGFSGGSFAIPVVQVNEKMHWVDVGSWDSGKIMELAKEIAALPEQ